MCKISIVVSIYNVEKYLRQCLDSIVNQSYRNLEIILVDDGSPDNCGAICDGYAATDERIRVIHKENGGLCAARNDGLAVATGTWVMFIDSDDWCETDYFTQLIAALKGETADVLCGGGCFIESNSTKKVKAIQTPFVFKEKDKIQYLAIRALASRVPVDEMVLGAMTCAPWDKLYNLDFLRRNNITFCRDLSITEDNFFNYQVLTRAKKVIGSLVIGYHYRQVPTSNTKRFRPDSLNECRVVLDTIYKEFMAQNDFDLFQVSVLYPLAIRAASGVLNRCLFNPSYTGTSFSRRQEFKELKELPLVKSALKSDQNQYLTKKEVVFKYLMRLPWVWPTQLIWTIYFAMKKIIKR